MAWYAVGNIDREEGYIAVNTVSENVAIDCYMKENPDEDRDFVQATKVANWQGKSQITPADWFNSGEGFSTSCMGCGEQVSKEFENGKVIKDEVWCDWCLEADYELISSN